MPELTNRQLIAFARDVLRGYSDGEVGDIDGGYLQDTAHRHGLLLETTATAPCDTENCICAEVGCFPATCYRLHPTLARDDNYDGPDDGDAWSGGFAPNH